ncbi:MAG: redox-sensing transcriptional repressor Rex [Verrucomicrobia bacterium]|nr:redox-sensing transcriptional repressor Rex [Verrucomicrobiota bacterium]
MSTQARNRLPDRTVERLSLYRRLVERMLNGEETYVYSHELGAMANSTAAQVRRDLMLLGCTGSPIRGYNVRELTDRIGAYLDAPHGQRIALIGIGNLGRAILAYFSHRRPSLSIVAAFDTDPEKVGRVIAGCRCYHVGELAEVVEREGIELGVITVPASQAQLVADQFVAAGVRGMLNFAPVRVRVPEDVTVEDMDITMSLEKIAYITRQRVTS